MYSIIKNVESQEILPRIAQRMEWKDVLTPYIESLYKRREKELEKKGFGAEQERNRATNFKNCGTNIAINDNGKITGANFCKQRLCPVCNFRRSSMMWHKINQIIEYDKDMDFIFVTLTVKNCTGQELNNTIDKVLQGFRRISNRKKWKRAFIGFVRGLEITYNPKEDTFHPHIHLLINVSKDYFINANYVDFDELRHWWEESCELNYHANVDIRKVKTEEKQNAVAEVAKYAVKMADLMKDGISSKTIKATEILFDAVYNRRLVSLGGSLLKIARILKIDIDDENDYNVEEKYNSTMYVWQDGTYKKI